MKIAIFTIASIFFLFYNIYIFKIKFSRNIFGMLLVILFISMIFLAYNYVPIHTNDLYRYYRMLDDTHNWNWQQYQNFARYRDTPITNLYFYSMKGVNNRSLFAAIPVMIVTLLLSKTIIYFNKIKKINLRAIILFLVSTISFATLILIISGLRQNVAWAFLMTAVYYDFYDKKRNLLVTLVLYTVTILIHLSTAPILALRIIYTITYKNNKLNYLIVLWPVLITIFQSFSSHLPLQFQLALGRFDLYLDRNVLDLHHVIAFWGYLILIILILRIRKNKDYQFINENYLNFYILILLFGFTSIFVPELFKRTFGFILYISLPLFAEVVDNNNTISHLTSSIFLSLQFFIFIYIDFLSGVFLR